MFRNGRSLFDYQYFILVVSSRYFAGNDQTLVGIVVYRLSKPAFRFKIFWIDHAPATNY